MIVVATEMTHGRRCFTCPAILRNGCRVVLDLDNLFEASLKCGCHLVAAIHVDTLKQVSACGYDPA